MFYDNKLVKRTKKGTLQKADALPGADQFYHAVETIYRELGDAQAVRDVTDKVKSQE